MRYNKLILPYFPKIEENLENQFIDFISTSSLTKYLKELNKGFKVLVTFMGFQELNKKSAIGVECQQHYFTREVCLLLNETIVVRARSSCVPKAIEWQNFLNCGNQALGELLFQQEELQRSGFSYLVVPQSNPLLQVYTEHSNTLARQSTFQLQEQLLILTECFLPEIENYLC